MDKICKRSVTKNATGGNKKSCENVNGAGGELVTIHALYKIMGGVNEGLFYFIFKTVL